MTEHEQNASFQGPTFQPFVEQWVSCVQHANEATMQRSGDFAACRDPQAWRQQWFATLSDSTDAYFRSPPFLRMLKTHIDTLIEVGQRPPSAAAPTAAQAPSAASREPDLAERWQRLQQALQGQLRQLEQPTAALAPGVDATIGPQGWDRFLSALHPAGATEQDTRGATPHQVVYQLGSLRVLRYDRDEPARFVEPVLICFALVNRPYILDLRAKCSVVRRLLERGFDVYLIDWGVPTADDHTLRLSDYVRRLLRDVVEFVCAKSASPQLHLLGYCMGGTLSTMFTALYPERVRNLILMAAPIDFEGHDGLLNVWARSEYFDVDRLVDTYGNCPGEFLQHCFQLMRPVQNFVEKYLRVSERLGDEAFLDNFFAMERWANDSIPVAGETFREFVKRLYQQNELIHGQMTLDGLPVRLAEITCPLLLLVANQDHLVPPQATLALAPRVRSSDIEAKTIDAGHIGLAVSSKAHRQLWPAAVEWIAEHATTKQDGMNDQRCSVEPD